MGVMAISHPTERFPGVCRAALTARSVHSCQKGTINPGMGCPVTGCTVSFFRVMSL